MPHLHELKRGGRAEPTQPNYSKLSHGSTRSASKLGGPYDSRIAELTQSLVKTLIDMVIIPWLALFGGAFSGQYGMESLNSDEYGKFV
jgi:hypothetical protein